MFEASAELYDLIYAQFKNYEAESEQLAALIRREHPRARTVLDVACGTAEHARILASAYGFDVDGLDLDPAFVRIAQAKLPNGTVFHGDMMSFALDRKYDIIVCLFSSIGYVRTLENVERTLSRFRAHLAEGGIVIVEPWFTPGVLEPGRVSLKTAEAPDVKVARMSNLAIEGTISKLTFEYMIGRASGIERATEVHELGLFTVGEMLSAFRAAGLAVEYDPKGPYDRGLYVARVATT